EEERRQALQEVAGARRAGRRAGLDLLRGLEPGRLLRPQAERLRQVPGRLRSLPGTEARLRPGARVPRRGARRARQGGQGPRAARLARATQRHRAEGRPQVDDRLVGGGAPRPGHAESGARFLGGGHHHLTLSRGKLLKKPITALLGRSSLRRILTDTTRSSLPSRLVLALSAACSCPRGLPKPPVTSSRRSAAGARSLG